MLLTTFVVTQAEGCSPLLRLGIFSASNLAAANLAQLLLGCHPLSEPVSAGRS